MATWAQVTRCKTRQEQAAFCQPPVLRVLHTSSATGDRSSSTFYKVVAAAPYNGIMGKVKCQCNMTGRGCNLKNCGYSRQ